jgi:hypothetical protein
MAERDQPVEGEIDDRCNDEARQAGELRGQAGIFGADKGHPGVDEITDDANRREGGNLLGDAPMGRGGRLDGVHERSRSNRVSTLWPKNRPPQASARTAS